MNIILAIWNAGGKGKSTTILELAKLLILRYPKYRLIESSKEVNNLTLDFRLVIEINGKVIALESQGDPNTGLEKRLEIVVNKHKPNYIICSCRTRGETVNAIHNISSRHSYDKVWTSTYETTHSQPLANQLKGEHLLDFINKMGLL
jgi:hypothetical protein